MNEAYIKLGIAALLPVFAAALVYFAEKKTPFGRLPYMVRQLLIGLLFGGLAIVGTEWGIPHEGAQLNCRDAAVLISGLLFGAPAGILAGCIGALERWIAVAWGVGTFTRVACTFSTLLAGFYAAGLRVYMFENKKPGWLISLAIGVVMEVFHLTMVFLTNMGTPDAAMNVIRICSIPMVTANGISVMLASLLLSVLSAEKGQRIGRKQSRVRISQTIQRWLLVTVLLAFLATTLFVFRLQNELADRQTDKLLTLALDETSEDIENASNRNLLTIAHNAAYDVFYYDLKTIVEKYGLSEMSIINKKGTIMNSTVPDFIGYDMISGEQSAEFLCLLEDTESFVQGYGPISYDSSIMRKYAGVRTDSGFVQVGYDAEQFQRDIDGQVTDITRNRHVGQTGFILILDESRNIVSAPAELTREQLEKEAAGVQPPHENETFEMTVNGAPAFCQYRTTEGYYLLSVYPRSEAMQVRNVALYVNTFMEVLVFAALFGLIYLLIKRVVVNQIQKINASLAQITGGDLGVVVNVRSNEEFASLSDDINSTVDTLKHYIDEASARIDKELEFAKNIQYSALPNVFPAFPKRKDFDIYACMDPAKEVGGDFYDFYMTHTDTLHFLVADVSGKGIPAAMFMMRAKTELKRMTEADLPLSEVFTQANANLCEGNDAGMFVTAWEGSIDLNTGLVQYANAGHNPPLVRHANGKFEYLKSRAGFVLAGMDMVRYRQQELQLERGDCIFLYTDGVTEATNTAHELFGEDRLLQAVNAQEFTDMNALCAYVRKEVDAFVGDAPQFDDITMVALHYMGKEPVPTLHFDEAKLEDITAVTAFVETELEKIDCPMKTVIQINVAIDELFSNIVRYGYPNKSGPVTVQLIIKEDPRAVYIRFEDAGIPYNPLTKEDPDITLSAEERSIGGLGIFMVKKTMDDIKYKYENDHNILTIMKNL